MKLRWLCLVLCICVFTPSTTNNILAASLAVSSATLSGRVTDPNGLVIVGAKVEATNVGTNVTFSSETNGEGFFVISNIPPGRYRVTVEKQGFQSIVKPDVELHVQDTIALNFAMQVGSIIQSVMVESGAPLVKTETADVSTLVNRQFVENLPLNGRSFQSLITLTPGTVLTTATVDNPGQFSVNGQRANSNYFTVDGVSANIGVADNPSLLQSGGSTPALSAAGGTNSLVSVDALQEFKILTSTYAPEFGRTPGGQVQIVTRSGTNRFSGTLFEYFRNDALDANDWFANSRRQPKPAERQNDFGGVFGGPVIKNRTFFFFSYEGLRLRQPLTRITDVPSLSTRATVPASIQTYLNAFPIPNGPDRVINGVPNGLAEFAASFSNPSTLNATSIRVDHTLNDRLTLFGRYNYAPSGTDQRGGQFGSTLSTVARTKYRTQTLTFGSTQSFTSNLSNDFRFNYSKTSTNTFFILDGFGGAVPPADALLFPSFTSPQNSAFAFFVFGGTGTNFRAGKIQKNIQDQVNIVDNLSLIVGSHQLKFGVDYRRLAPLRGGRTYQQLAQSPTVAPLLLGRVPSVLIDQLEPGVGLIFNNFSAYAQDAWKVKPRLTLTYGLRWEVNPPPSVSNAEPPFAVTGIENPATLALAPRGTPLYQTTYDNFAPRVGVAYQFSNKQGRETMLRGGFGVFYDLGNATAGNIPNSFPYVTTKSLSNVPFPLDGASAQPAPFSTALPVTAVIMGFDQSLKLPRTYQWNLAIEQSLGVNQTVSASYVAAVGRRLTRQDFLFAPSSNFRSTVLLIRDTATSDYHALQLQFQRRLSSGLQAVASYTWSHSIDEASGDAQTLGLDRARGPSNFDIRHSFSSAVTYNIPTLSNNGFGRAVLGGWALDTIVVARSAAPVNIIATQSFLPSGDLINFRPNLIQGVPLYVDDPSVGAGRRINRAAFAAPPAGQQGNLGRNALRAFSVWQADLALRRQFNITERLKLQFRAEFFNVFNHPNFANPNGSLSIATFGQSTQMFGSSLSGGGGSGLNPLYQIGGPRSIQLALKIQF